MKILRNEDIIDKLCNTDKSKRQEAMLYLYKRMYKRVGQYVQKNSGTSIESEDVFQDAMVALYKHACSGRLGNHIRVEAYLFTICKNIWLKELQKKGKTIPLTDRHDVKSNIKENQEAIMIDKERSELIENLIRSIGSNCYQVLRYYYYEKRKMKEIASLLSLTNEQAAKDKKASCMKKLRLIVRDNPHFLEILKSS